MALVRCDTITRDVCNTEEMFHLRISMEQAATGLAERTARANNIKTSQNVVQFIESHSKQKGARRLATHGACA